MMVGLVAMLGAKAEAHYIVVGGTPKRCNHCVEGEFKKDHDRHSGDHTDEAEYRLRTKRVDFLCPSPNATTEPKTVRSEMDVELVVQKQIVEGDATKQIDRDGRPVEGDATYEIDIDKGDRIGPARVNIDVEFSDSLLKEKFSCPAPVQGQRPIAAIIREALLTIVTYSCKSGSPCEVFDDDFVRRICTFDRFNFGNYPPEGYPFVCRQQ